MTLKIFLDGQDDMSKFISIVEQMPMVEMDVQYPTGKEQDAIIKWARRHLPNLTIRNALDQTIIYSSNKSQEYAQENMVIDIVKEDGDTIRRLIAKGYITLGGR